MPRYIDAEKLIEHLKDEISRCEPPVGGRANGKSVAYGTMRGLKMAISFAQTLPEAPFVKRKKYKNVLKEVKTIIAEKGLNMPERYINSYDFAEIIENLDITVAGKPARWNDAKYTVLQEIAQCPDANVAPREEVAREIIGEVFSYVQGNEKLTENIPEIELFKFGTFIGELEKKYDPKNKKIITDNAHQE